MRRVQRRVRSPGLRAAIALFSRAENGAAAVEFALVSLPFVLLLLVLLQMGIYYMTQSSLDAGVIEAGDSLVNTFYNGATPTVPTAAALKSLVVANSGGLIKNDATLSVELRQLATLGAAALPITNVVDPSAARNVLALRAQASVVSFMPGFGSLNVRSSTIVRRQGS